MNCERTRNNWFKCSYKTRLHAVRTPPAKPLQIRISWMAANTIEIRAVDVVCADEFQRRRDHYVVRYFETRLEVISGKASRRTARKNSRIGIVAKAGR